jgi:hypothetical protein
LANRITTKRKVDLISSHSENERDNGPLAAYSLEGSPADDLLLHKHRVPAFLRYIPKDGEQVTDEYYYVPPDD